MSNCFSLADPTVAFDAHYFASLPSPISIWRKVVSLRSFEWGQTFTPAQRAQHVVARKRFSAEGGVPNLFTSECEPPQPWLGIRRFIRKAWLARFKGDERQGQCDELIAYVCRQVAEEFSPEELRTKHDATDAELETLNRRVVGYAKVLTRSAIADICAGVRRYSSADGLVRPGCDAILDNPATDRLIDDQTDQDDGEALDRGETLWSGVSGNRRPCEPLDSFGEENALIDAIDRARLKPTSQRAERVPLEKKEIDRTKTILTKLFGSEWTSLVGTLDEAAPDSF